MTARSTLPVLLLAAAACQGPASQRGDTLPLPLPPRTASTPGSELAARWAGLPLAQRERAASTELERGNVPSFLACTAPVRLRAMIGGAEHEAVVWCAADHFGFGTDGDWLRLPMTPQLAQRIADALGCVLPTPRLVDAIWQQADRRVAPVPFDPREHDILSVAVFAASHAAIERQLAGEQRPALLAGGKKDVVLSARLAARPGRVAIHGWHRLDGTPIQPLSTVHGTGHVDYSHGIRLVARAMLLDGRPTTVDAVLADPVLHVLLSADGPIDPARYPPAVTPR